MFTQPCLVRNNSRKLRRSIEKMGYKNIEEIFAYYGNCIYVFCDIEVGNSACYILMNERDLDIFLHNHKEVIDCGKNSRLFKSISALRDDTDKYQWFTNNENYIWYCCTKNECTDKCLHKATIKELIEHFK